MEYNFKVYTQNFTVVAKTYIFTENFLLHRTYKIKNHNKTLKYKT